MLPLLAYAEQTDVSGSQWTLVVYCGLVVGAAAILAAVVIGVARSRRHRLADGITGLALLWAIGAAASGITTVIAQVKWAKDYTQLIESGYFDPRNTTGAPALPWVMWSVLTAVYVALLLVTVTQRQGATPAPPSAPK